MSDQSATPAPESQATPDASQEARTVPYERFAQVNQQARERQQQLEQLQQRLADLEDRDKSEVERERTKREQFERQATEATQRLERMEKQGWLRDAAAAANFHNPSTAANLIDLSGITSAEEAEKAVKNLAKREKYLVREEQPAPQLGQVLANGQRVNPADAQRDEQSEAFMAQIRAAQESEGWQSIPLD